MVFLGTRVVCDIKKRFIFLNGDIRFITFTIIENAIKRLRSHDSKKPINFFITTEGGDFYASFQICQLLRRTPIIINTIAVDFANSGGFLILQAGNKRFSTKETTIGFHRAKETHGSIEALFKENNNDVNSEVLLSRVRELMMIDAQQLLIFGERGRPITKIKELFSKNAEISAKQALELNLIDGILPKNKIPKI